MKQNVLSTCIALLLNLLPATTLSGEQVFEEIIVPTMTSSQNRITKRARIHS
jgi:hypothetical protein